MAERITREELRLLIREVLKEAMSESPPPLRGRDREGGKSQPPRPSPFPLPYPSPQGGGVRASSTPFTLTTGLLTEAKVAEIGKAHSRIEVGAEVVVTPLARDRARLLKVEIARQKP
jgi:hypothetical protein